MTKIMLWQERKSCASGNPEDDFQPYMETFLLEDTETKGAVIICPGGGYSHRADHEGAPVAKKFNQAGYHAFVVQYRVAPYRFPAPQEDILRAIKIVRSKAEEWYIKPDKIAVLGFSAGGHLACSSGIVFDEVEAINGDSADAVSARPDATILCYPVISGVNMGHGGSFKNLLGEEFLPQKLKRYSWECRVKPDTPPSFLWHTAADAGVPVENSLNYAAALRAMSIPFELHVFPDGRHGLGLGTDDSVPEIRIWPDLCAAWLRRMGW